MKLFLLTFLLSLQILLCHSDFACPPGWMKHGSSCYHFSHDEETWADASIMCRQLGGHLVDIGSATENSFLLAQVKLINKLFWIDATDVQVEGDWVWMNTKSKLVYTNWGTGEPNNVHGTENCAELNYHGYWNDNACKNANNYVCEMEEGEAQGVFG